MMTDTEVDLIKDKLKGQLTKRLNETRWNQEMKIQVQNLVLCVTEISKLSCQWPSKGVRNWYLNLCQQDIQLILKYSFSDV